MVTRRTALSRAGSVRARALGARGGLAAALLVSALGAAGCLVDFALPPDPVQDAGTDATAPRCGDGVMDPGEACDGSDLGGATCESLTGVAGGAPACHEDCTYDLAACDGCGNGTVEQSEACDDGNRDAGDGCGPGCQVEPGWICDTGSCEPVCGDGIVVGGEPCDDGNAEAGDGCTPGCQVEPFHACWGSPSTCPCVLYVNQASVSNPARTGASWDAALARPQDALTVLASLGDCEIWVAEGTYAVYEVGPDDTLALPSGLALYGGFAGDETRRSAREPDAHPTILSGASSDPGSTDHVRSVVTILNASDVTLDGFVVTGANQPNELGGGVYVDTSQNVSIRSCRIVDNASRKGAGLRIRNGSSVHLVGCAITGNTADDNGGGIYVEGGGTLTLDESQVRTNTTQKDGAGLYASGGGGVTATRSWFLSNMAAQRGGAARLSSGGTYRFESCVFAQNSATSAAGGALHAYGASTHVSMVSCTLWNNRGDASGRVLSASYAHLTVTDSILWDSLYDSDFVALSNGGTLDLSYSDVRDTGLVSPSTPGMITVNPLLSDPASGDFHLLPASPCIDAADGDAAPALDLDGLPRVDVPGTPNTGAGVAPWADMGAFEYQPPSQ